jgi:hypothetical protein
MKTLRRAAIVATCCAALVPILSGCALDGAEKASGASVVAIGERDFHISAPRRLHAGAVELQVSNRGPSAHELILVRDSSVRLPLRSDGLTVDEEKLEPKEVGALEPAQPGIRDLNVRLRPGTYQLFCNMYGHFKGGMHRTLVVR